MVVLLILLLYVPVERGTNSRLQALSKQRSNDVDIFMRKCARYDFWVSPKILLLL